ncbi:MAG TPA: hypothetical protein VKV17_23230 [Bryobacteraceae bacterium]|nr:hypothetical protein [Bryobacteraceae bacterium]
MLRCGAITLTAAAAIWTCISAKADVIAPPYASDYTLTNLGTPAGVPGPLGGITFLNDNTLLLGGNANRSSGAIYEIGVTRDSSGTIDGFSGSATLYATAPFIDGGLAFGPGGDLFATGYPNNTLLEYKPGDSSPDKTVDLSSAGITSSVGSSSSRPTVSSRFSVILAAGFTPPL